MPTEDQLREIHRLAVLGDVAAIAQEVGGRLTNFWLRVSRFREAREVSRQTLTLGPHAETLIDLARARSVLGELHEALTLYLDALTMCEDVGDRAGQAATLNNIGAVYDRLSHGQQALAYYQQALSITEAVGDRVGQATTLRNIGLFYDRLGDGQQALAYYHQALPIQEAVGDRAGESVTRYNMAMLYRAHGEFAEAVEELRQVVALDAQVQHPDLASDQAMLRQVEQEWQQSVS